MNDLLIFGVPALATIATVVEAAKKFVKLPSRFAPLLSIAVGVVVGLAFGADPDWVNNALVGVALGLSASGGYSVVKRTVLDR